jgi:glutamine phosphoribosylpyrophosphate amidotransferase
VSSDGADLHQFRSQGLVADVLNEEVLSKLKGSSAIGHTRYSTTGKNTIKEVQPFAVTCQHGDIAICHNGNLPFAEARRRELEKEGADTSHRLRTRKPFCIASLRSQGAMLLKRSKSVEGDRGSVFDAFPDTEEFDCRARPCAGFVLSFLAN